MSYEFIKKITLVIFGICIGILAIYQYKLHERYADVIADRDSETSFYSEVNLLLRNNQNLKDEIEDLRDQLNEYSDQEKAVIALRDEVEKKEKIAGIKAVKGPGLEISIEEDIDLFWVVDLVNESLNAGAEAVSINGIRIVNHTDGITRAGGQMMINGTVLQTPYVFQFIGDTDVFEKALTQAGGILTRVRMQYPNSNMEMSKEKVIVMKKVL